MALALLGQISNAIPMWLLVLTFGLTLGSFMNVVVHRLPIMRENNRQRKQGWHVPEYNLAFPKSACIKCKHEVRWYENIPVLSYLYLRGKCSSCGTHISIRYPIIELAFGLGFLAFYHLFS